MPIIIQYTLAVIGLVFSFGYGYGQWKQGRNQNSLDNDSIYKSRIEALELNDKEKTAALERLTKEVRDLHEEIDLRDKKFAEAILTLQGKDPIMAEFIKVVNEYMSITKPTIGRMDKFLDGQILQ